MRLYYVAVHDPVGWTIHPYSDKIKADAYAASVQGIVFEKNNSAEFLNQREDKIEAAVVKYLKKKHKHIVL